MKSKLKRIRGHKCPSCGTELNIVIGDMQSNGITGSASCSKCKKFVWLRDYRLLNNNK